MNNSMHIDDYGFGKITINGAQYEEDVIILRDHVHAGWWRRKGHELHPEDLEKVFEFEPELLVVGTGYYGRMKVLKSARDQIEAIGCELVVEKTKRAYIIFNEANQKKAAAALHLTC